MPLLLAAHWLLRKEKAQEERVFRVLAGTQIALLLVMMVSAVQRMRLYQREYGLTELRVYDCFYGWLAAVFIWFAMTVLRGQRERFAFGAVVTGFLAIGALLAVNPDRLIARVNVEYATAGRDFDAAYAASLSADAVPELIASLPRLNSSQRCALASRYYIAGRLPEAPDGVSWNWSRAEAPRAMASGEQELCESACL